MKNIIKLTSLILSLLLAKQAEAQTCVTPPNCEVLGYDKTALDCVGKTILKCPFDANKIYCPGEQENWKTYKLGDYYTKEGMVLGKVADINSDGTHGLIITINARTGNIFEASAGCAAMKDGGLRWALPNIEHFKLKTLSKEGYSSLESFWRDNGGCGTFADPPKIGNLICLTGVPYCQDSSVSNNLCTKEMAEPFRLAYHCVAAF